MQGPIAPTPSVLGEGEASSPAVSPTLGTHVQKMASAPPVEFTQAAVRSVPSPPLTSPARFQLQAAERTPVLEDPGIKRANTAQGRLPGRAASGGTGSASAVSSAITELLPMTPRSEEATPPGISAAQLRGDKTDDWAILVRKMRALGVNRFSIEGDTGDRVVFACLIPLAGRQAISQRFEAEGTTPAEAVQAALRRIVLWHTSQTALPATPRQE